MFHVLLPISKPAIKRSQLTVSSFDERANGYARGEGVGMLVLKHIDDAIRDHDCIRAVIRGVGVNQDGKTPGITLPSSEAQTALIRSTYRAAGLDPIDTAYFEAHGTGTGKTAVFQYHFTVK